MLICPINSKGKDILIFNEGLTKRLDDMTLTGEGIYSINFTHPNKRFVLSLKYNGSTSLLFVSATKIYQLKTKNTEMKDYALCLDNISKDFKINNMKKTGIKGVVIFFLLILFLLILTIFLDIH